MIIYKADGSTFTTAERDDVDFHLSLRIEHGGRSQWFFGSNPEEQEQVIERLHTVEAETIEIFPWDEDVVRPELEWWPVRRMIVYLRGRRAVAAFNTGERKERRSLVLLSANTSVPDAPVRFGHDAIYRSNPILDVGRILDVAVEFARTNVQPTSVEWQEPSSYVPNGPFGKRLVDESDLPPRLFRVA